MTKRQLAEFVDYLLKDAEVFAPVEANGELIVKRISGFGEISWQKAVPMTTFKPVLLPERQVLFDYQQNRVLTEVKPSVRKVAFGMRLPDLKAVGLFHQVFERDPYYQAQRNLSLLIGQTEMPLASLKGSAGERFEEDVLEHLIFDIFLIRTSDTEWRVYSGSEKGQRTLDRFGYSQYENIEFVGLLKEEGVDPNLAKWRKLVVESHAQKIWDYWGSRCIACGKCAVDCPTCFCFDIKDEPDEAKPNQGQRVRQWTTCFYNNFSQIGGGTYSFLKTNGQRIENWYLHKFVRIPREFQLIGCVNCGRCDKVCPVGINRHDVLTSLEHPDDSSPRHLKGQAKKS